MPRRKAKRPPHRCWLCGTPYHRLRTVGRCIQRHWKWRWVSRVRQAGIDLMRSMIR